MIGRREIRWTFYLFVISIMTFCSMVFADDNRDSLNIIPDCIQIGTFYHGTEVRVSANAADCDGAVIVLEGNDEDIELNRKGRVAIIWMNVARITIKSLPRVYIMAASDKLENICPKEVQMKLRLGLESLRSQMEVYSDKPLTGKEFDQFLELKIHNGTYDTENKIELKPTASGGRKLSSALRIPSQMPPGMYDIHLYCFKRGEMIEENEGRLKVERVGLPDFMISLANRHAAIYGLLAISIAMVAGITMGFIFSSLPGRRR
jgi:uncharacterized protein (TIGR02186 family)